MAIQTHEVVFTCGALEVNNYLAIKSAVEQWQANEANSEVTIQSVNFNLVAKKITIVVTGNIDF